MSSGFWEGQVFKLRGFPCQPSSGSCKGVDYEQNMGRISLKYVFRDELSALCASELSVELSSWELKVKTLKRPDLDPQLAPLNGSLYGDIRRDLSWWTLETEASSGLLVFTIELAKRDHKAWNAVWKPGMNHHRKSHFGWTPASKSTKKAEEILTKVKPGRLKRKEDVFVMRREDLCAALEDGQDDQKAIYRIHLDKAALDKACETVCLADLFAVDVMEQYLKVFIRGDEKSPILMGQLFEKVQPDQSRWEIVKAAAPVDESGQAPVNLYNTCLQVSLTKAKASKKHWPHLMVENELVLQREAAPAIEELHSKAIRAPSPDRSGWSPEELAKDFKSKADSCFKSSAWRDAVVYYTRALSHMPEDEKLFSNRSACYVKLKKFDKALVDAKKCASLKPEWSKAYFRVGQAHRGLRQWEDALAAFREGRFREPTNKEWEKEISKTEEEQEKWDAHVRDQRKLKREADLVTELNEATVVAEREAMVAVAEQAMKAGKSRKEAGELAMKGAELAKQRVHEMAAERKGAMMVEDDQELDSAAPYRIVCEDGSLHSKSFAHTDKGMYFMGMTLMNYKSAPSNQPWIELRHPQKLRWSQGCGVLRLKVFLPDIRGPQDLEVTVTVTSMRIGTTNNSDPIVEGIFDRKVDPHGENYSWFLVPDEDTLEMTLDKDKSEVYQTFSYGTLLWPRLFNDDIPLGEGLFEADLTDLPPQLLEKFHTDQARSDEQSQRERQRRQMMTEEEVAEETARMWNDEFARHGIPHRVDSMEDRRMDSYQK